MKNYKKFIVITLILVMLFNIVQIQEVSADLDNLMRAGLIAFLITINIYNVSVMSRDALMTLFNDFWNSKTNTEQNEFVNSFKSVWQNSFTSGIMSVVIMPYIHSWIRENFSKGYNVLNVYKNEEYVESIGNKNDYELEKNYIDIGGKGKYKMSVVGYDYVVDVYGDNGYGRATYLRIYMNGELKLDKDVGSWNSHRMTIVDGYPDYMDFNFYCENMKIWWERKIEFNMDDIEEKEIESKIIYYAGEAVDYPMEKEVEDKYIPLPVPDVGMGIPGLDYDVGGNKVFDGTVDQFLDGALDNADYLDSTIDKLLEGGYATSHPYVNVDAGTITWPATGSVTYPDTGVIDYPDVTIPESVVEGIGETNSILQGIGSFIESIFSAPTVELDLSPLTNVNLKEKFPFCLPFDLATLITGLSSKDKDPLNVNFEFKVFNNSYSIPIDFTIFQDWAIIVNWFVLILFIVGLIMISRKLIGG